MSAMTCRWVEENLEEYLGGCLPHERQIKVELHLAVCESCQTSARIWRGLTRTVPRGQFVPLSPIAERRLLSGKEPAQARPSATRRWPGVAVAIAASAAALAIILSIADSGRSRPPAASIGEIAAAPKTPRSEKFAALDDPLNVSPQIDGFGRRYIPVSPGTTLWVTADADVHVETLDSRNARFRLKRGLAVAEVGPLEPGFRFIVSTPESEMEARGTLFSVRVRNDGRARVRVVEGVVEVRHAARVGESRLVTAGHELDESWSQPLVASKSNLTEDLGFVFGASTTSTRSSPRTKASAERSSNEPAAADSRIEKRSTAGDLLHRAQGRRAAGDYRGAAALYEQLIETCPGTSSAGAAMVALGQLRLTAMGQPASALAHFDEYLERAPVGNLSAEALAGRVRALARLKQPSAVVSAATRYLKKYPRRHAAAEMYRRRGQGLAALGDCDSAVRDFKMVCELWSASAEADRARTGLEACGVVP